MRAARRAGMKQEQFGYVEGGYGTVLERLSINLYREANSFGVSLSII